MKLDVEKKIDARVLAAFDGIVPGPDAKARQVILNTVRALVGAVWSQKIYAALPKDKTKELRAIRIKRRSCATVLADLFK